MALNLSTDDGSDLDVLDVPANGPTPSRLQVRNYLGSLADAYNLPRELVHAVAQTQSGFATDRVRANRPTSDVAQLGSDNQRYGVMQVSDDQIGKTVRDGDGASFQIGENIRTDWKANADAGVALFAQHYRLAEMEQPYSTMEVRAQQAYSGYSAGNALRDRYLATLPYSDAPAHPDDRAFLQNLVNAASSSGEETQSRQSSSKPQPQAPPQPAKRPGSATVPADTEPTSGALSLQRIFPDQDTQPDVNYHEHTVSSAEARAMLDRISVQLNRPIDVTSGDRNYIPQGGAINSLHLQGRAADFHVRGMSDQEVFQALHGEVGSLDSGMHLLQHGPFTATEGPHLHLEYRGGKDPATFAVEGLTPQTRGRAQRIP
jgi:hypothetical protein